MYIKCIVYIYIYVCIFVCIVNTAGESLNCLHSDAEIIIIVNAYCLYIYECIHTQILIITNIFEKNSLIYGYVCVHTYILYIIITHTNIYYYNPLISFINCKYSSSILTTVVLVLLLLLLLLLVVIAAAALVFL